MEKNTQNVLTEEMIPIATQEGESYEMLRVSVDGYDAEIFIIQRWGSDKVVIKSDELHPRWLDIFTTKHFFFEKPGEMRWGHDEEVMIMSLADK